MLRTPIIAAFTVALLGGTAFVGGPALAQPANSPPSNLSNSARTAPDYDDENMAPPPGYQGGYSDNGQRGAPPPSAQSDAQASAQDQRDRDMFCRRDAAARTGYTTPGQAASDEQARGTIGGTLGGAALGAIIGAGAGNAGLGAAAGAGAGLIAGTAIGSDNAHHAAADVQAAYGDAYYACMHEDGRSAAGYGAPPPGYGPGYGYGYGPPPPGYYPPPYGYGGYGYGYPYYGPNVSFGFGFGGGRHRGWR
jgi:hypothetical protein